MLRFAISSRTDFSSVPTFTHAVSYAKPMSRVASGSKAAPCISRSGDIMLSNPNSRSRTYFGGSTFHVKRAEPQPGAAGQGPKPTTLRYEDCGRPVRKCLFSRAQSLGQMSLQLKFCPADVVVRH